MWAALLLAGSGCKILGPEPAEFSLACVPSDANNQCIDPDFSEHDGTMSARMGDAELEFRTFARPSGYDSGQVVLHGYADGHSRVLQLTFELGDRSGKINREMTGFWDLGLCTPHDAYILEDQGDASVSVLSYEPDSRRLRGTFWLRAVHEHSPDDAISFVNGVFDVRVRAEAFEYCIEG